MAMPLVKMPKIINNGFFFITFAIHILEELS